MLPRWTTRSARGAGDRARLYNGAGGRPGDRGACRAGCLLRRGAAHLLALWREAYLRRGDERRRPTGQFLAADHWPGARPDVVVLAKGLSAGYAPMGAALFPAAMVRAGSLGRWLHARLHLQRACDELRRRRRRAARESRRLVSLSARRAWAPCCARVSTPWPPATAHRRRARIGAVHGCRTRGGPRHPGDDPAGAHGAVPRAGTGIAAWPRALLPAARRAGPMATG